MAEEDKNKSKAKVQNRPNSVQHLDKDPNDPRRVPPAETGFSLNEDDPETKPKWQNPVK